MNDIPIESLMGWTLEWSDAWNREWKRPDGEIGGPATVDELAAWLNEHDEWNWKLARGTMTDGGVSWQVLRYDDYADEWVEIGLHPTIREALVDAVREVAR